MREASSIFVYKLDFSPSKDRVKTHLASKGKDEWDSYFPMGTYGYMEVSTMTSKTLYDCYILNSYGEGINKPINETTPAPIPFHGERGDLLKGTYRYSREPVIQSRYFGNLEMFFIEEVVSLDKFILPKCEEKYQLWETFIMQISR